MEKVESNLLTTLQKNLRMTENKNKKLKKELDILTTQNNFLDSQLEYSEKKYKKKELILKGLKSKYSKIEKQLKEISKERDDLLIDKLTNSSQISKEVYETGGQSTNIELTLDKNKIAFNKNEMVL